jgi:polysaccharide export outer membrane protein
MTNALTVSSNQRPRKRGLRAVAWVVLPSMLVLGGCATSASGPTFAEVADQGKKDIHVIKVDASVAQRVLQAQQVHSFTQREATPNIGEDFKLGAGDVIEVSVWEAPPASLFGANLTSMGGASGNTHNVIPAQTVTGDGRINVPFAGLLDVAGKTPRQVEAEVVQRLRGKANQPQVMLRVLSNANASVTVVGEVSKSMRMSLTPRGERLLDAIANAGGVTQPTSKTTVQLARAGRVWSMPLDRVIQDPTQNVRLQPGDVVTAVHKPMSLVVLGATGRNEEMQFEAQGISLAQALGRASGVADNRADSRGLFVFRFEDPAAVGDAQAVAKLPKTADGRVPVVYQVDLKDPRTFLVAQHFPMKHQDVMFVSNAPSAELQKFLNILTSSVFSIAGVASLAGN